MTTHYMTISWDQLHRDARTLSERLSNRQFKGIVAITRGGMIPAAIIARELECRLIDTVSIVSYDEEEQGELKIIKHPTIAGDGEGFLIVDDLVDSGITAKAIRKLLPKAYFVCLYAKPAGKPCTDDFIMEVQQDTWILFPWDSAPAFAPPLIKIKK
ncbi:xanthine phosphoribosyltransferase [Commensalibacter papalotli (ex Servin-Garciduenas et al. 2014)]|uniref:Xanthine-guanine phosphoribosyltransferase n=1 Tax=Commensalibacter papalotli (ex Servin-Garciduenas et al. 2014) TaxID=1208583 RepID=W7DNN6_9PROT|nr:xanthine phosphoribosyltransferase [Commensalibacter papalotli (ex Servin-Garciduenas et al. 2014)]EUK18897.1 xanthine-guanine phosphoribosyltransferase [Commensalibacter papalotli (ex Servin-Garciduenas et al. 2014)]